MEMFCKDLKNLAMIKERNDTPNKWTNRILKKVQNFHICKNEFSTDKKNRKVRDLCHYWGKLRLAAHNTCNLRYKLPKKTPLVFHNGSIYDHHFVIKQSAIEFKDRFDCLGENTEKYITPSAPIYKRNDNNETIDYKLKFIHSFGFMQTSLSSLVDNLSDNYKKECELCKEIKIMSECRFFGLKTNELHYQCKECNDESYKSINGSVKKFPIVYQYDKDDLNKFVLLLRNCYEDMYSR